MSQFFTIGNGTIATRQGGVQSPRLFTRYIRDLSGLERLLFKNLGFLGFLKKPKNPEKSKNQVFRFFKFKFFKNLICRVRSMTHCIV
jgi:hypothetical protein